MFVRARNVLILFSFVSLFAAKWFYSYYSYNSSPEFSLIGLEKDKSYKDVIAATLKVSNGYKIADISASLDGKPLTDLTKNIGKSSFELPFAIDTKILSAGLHTFEISLTDASKNANNKKESFSFRVDNEPLKAAFATTEYKVEQGRTIHVKINTNKDLTNAKVNFSSHNFTCFPENNLGTTYECFIPLECEEQPGESMIVAEVEDALGNSLKLSGKVVVTAAEFKKQSGFHVEQTKLNEEKQLGTDNKTLEDSLEKLAKESPNKKLWSGRFDVPLDVKRISTPFGEIRVTQEKGKYMHKAVDLVNMPKSVIWASQSGKVVIKDRFAMSGNTIVLDHGHGIFTLYYHLDDFANIEIGDFVKKGNPIGKLGSTGYAGGPHLHWELRVNNMAVDPLQWTENNF